MGLVCTPTIGLKAITVFKQAGSVIIGGLLDEDFGIDHDSPDDAARWQAS